MPKTGTRPARKAGAEKPVSARKRSGSRLAGLAFALAAIAVLALLLTFYLKRNWAELKQMMSPVEAGPGAVLRIYDRDDKLVCTLTGDSEDRIPVSLSEISPNLRDAVIAAEDHSFYSHHGISIEGTARAAFKDLISGHLVEGGSTITQQLAKILYSSGKERNFATKLKEAIIAWQLETKYPKDRLLQDYLNQVYFGRGAYGIERAAQLYFGKHASKLNLAESAFLAALINSPSRLSQPEHRPDAIKRQRLILKEMEECKAITGAQERAAEKTALVLRKPVQTDSFYLYYVDAVLSELRSSFGLSPANYKGLDIYTNMDQAAQKFAVSAVNRGIARAPRGVRQGALVSISAKDGTVLALVGGAGNYWQHQFNRATSPHTVGSAFKPFVYLAGILAGVVTPQTVVVDEPIEIMMPNGKPYCPRNFDHRFRGALTARQALALSINTCAVKVAVDTGLNRVIDVARKAGINDNMAQEPAIALGSCAVSPLRMASAYATFASGGIRQEPELLRKVSDRKGNTLLLVPPKSSARVFADEPVAELVDLMQDVVKYGTGRAAQIPGRVIAGKTGTSDQAKDLWFVGFTPDLVTATWGGNDENTAIPGSQATGGSVMASIWRDYTSHYYAAHHTPVTQFQKPATPMIHELPVLENMPPLAAPFQNQEPGYEQNPPFIQGAAGGGANPAPERRQAQVPIAGTATAPAELQSEHKKGILSKFGHFFKKVFR